MSDRQPKRKYDSTIARIAGNLLSGDDRAFVVYWEANPDSGSKEPVVRVNSGIVQGAVATARAIVAEVERTEPAK